LSVCMGSYCIVILSLTYLTSYSIHTLIHVTSVRPTVSVTVTVDGFHVHIRPSIRLIYIEFWASDNARNYVRASLLAIISWQKLNPVQ